MVALGLSISAVIWMDIIPIILANWWQHSILQMWVNKSRPLISGCEKTLFIASNQELEQAINKDKFISKT